MTSISANCILKTVPKKWIKKDYALITVQIETPYYVWCELLTHKRLSRNATSNRAMPANTNLNLGYFIPDNFYGKQKGMQSGERLDAITQSKALEIWIGTWEYCKESMIRLDALGVAKEQASRVLPTFKIMKGLVTATYSAWVAMLSLRMNVTADRAMQDLANKIYKSIECEEITYSENHLPFLLEEEKELPEKIFLSAGRIARLSYGDIKNKDGDIELGKRLLNDGHFSCFEHSANWGINPLASNLCSKNDDKLNGYYGWTNARSYLELYRNLDGF